MKTKRKNKEDIVSDSMFWPIMPYSSNSVENEYDVPHPESDQYVVHDTYLFSMWKHYVGVCQHVTLEQSLPSLGSFAHGKAKRQIASMVNTSQIMNTHVNLNRLDVFCELAKGYSIPSDNDIAEIANTNIVIPFDVHHHPETESPCIIVEQNIAQPVQQFAPLSPAAVTDTVNTKLTDSPTSFANAWQCLSPDASVFQEPSNFIPKPPTLHLPEQFDKSACLSFSKHSNIDKMHGYAFREQSLFSSTDEGNVPSSFSTDLFMNSSPVPSNSNTCRILAEECTTMDDMEYSLPSQLFVNEINDMSSPLLLGELKEKDLLSFMNQDDEDEEEMFNIFEASNTLLGRELEKGPSLSPLINTVDSANSLSACDETSADLSKFGDLPQILPLNRFISIFDDPTLLNHDKVFPSDFTEIICPNSFPYKSSSNVLEEIKTKE